MSPLHDHSMSRNGEGPDRMVGPFEVLRSNVVAAQRVWRFPVTMP